MSAVGSVSNTIRSSGSFFASWLYDYNSKFEARLGYISPLLKVPE